MPQCSCRSNSIIAATSASAHTISPHTHGNHNESRCRRARACRRDLRIVTRSWRDGHAARSAACCTHGGSIDRVGHDEMRVGHSHASAARSQSVGHYASDTARGRTKRHRARRVPYCAAGRRYSFHASRTHIHVCERARRNRESGYDECD